MFAVLPLYEYVVQPKRWIMEIEFQFSVVFSAEAESEGSEHTEDVGLLRRQISSEEVMISPQKLLGDKEKANHPSGVFIDQFNDSDKSILGAGGSHMIDT